MAERKLKIHGVYRHYKGDYYIVEGVATHSETGEKLVIYRGLYGDGPLYARPYDMFLEKVNKSNQRYRFGPQTPKNKDKDSCIILQVNRDT